ncbi:MAG: thiamine phosphate synthase [Alphaproteobacteria bacterium]|nr:thiamine phosphate synthase [Alphaproteobacteria bacterium]
MSRRCRLYLITPPRIDAGFGDLLRRALEGGDVASLQLRLKDEPDDVIVRASEQLLPIAQKAGVAFIVNDRPDLALRMGADGVHLGQGDAPLSQARALLGHDRMIGVTCHASKHLAMEAAEAGADYVAFGAFFPTVTKEVKARATPDLLTWWQDIMQAPCVAIGGITVENAAVLVEAGADFLAVCGGVWNHPQGPANAVRRFNDIFESSAK